MEDNTCERRRWTTGCRTIRWRAMVIAGLLWTGAVQHPAARAREAPERSKDDASSRSGFVLEKFDSASALAAAGLEPGDLLLSWERPSLPPDPIGGRGAIRSPVDWDWVRIELVPRGPLRLKGERRGEPWTWSVEPGWAEAEGRAWMAADQLAIYREGLELLSAEEPGSGGPGSGGVELEEAERARAEHERAERGATLLEGMEVRDSQVRCWLDIQLGHAWRKKRDWERAHAAYRRALGSAHDPVSRSAVWTAIGRTQVFENAFDAAEASYTSALESYREAGGEGLGVAFAWNWLGSVSRRRGQIELAGERNRRALEIQRRLAPDGLGMASSLNGLGIVAWKQGRHDEAARLYEQVLELRRRHLPEQQIAPIYINLGVLAEDRGQMEEALAYHRKALRIWEAEDPESLAVAVASSNIGSVVQDRGQLDVAVMHFQRALKIFRDKLPHDSLQASALLNNLGMVAHEQGRLEEAEGYLKESLQIKQKLAPDSLQIASGFNNLGILARDRGALDVAEQYCREALALKREIAPKSLGMAASLVLLGSIVEQQGHFESAAETFEEALEIYRRLSPGTAEMAISLNHLGGVARKLGQLDRAEDLFARSLEVVDDQAGRLGGSQWIQGGFRARFRAHFLDYIDLLLERGRAAEAFAVLERFRARSFLTMLGERDLIFSEIPEELGRQRRQLAARHHEVLRSLASLGAEGGSGKTTDLHAELAEIAQERDTLRAEIRLASPNLASLRDPQPLDLAAAREMLDPGTVMLSYSVGPESTDLFAIAPGRDLEVHTVPIGERRLREEVEAFREMVEVSASGGFLGGLRRQGAEKAGRRLYTLLVAPAETMVAAGERIVLVLDGPLHRLPFAALIRDFSEATDGEATDGEATDGEATDGEATDGEAKRDSTRSWQYFVEHKPLHTVLSATVYAELRALRHTESSTLTDDLLLAAFGDPRYGKNEELGDAAGRSPEPASGDAEAADIQVRAAREKCTFAVERLPASRREVLDISSLFRNVQTYLGEGAREEAVKSLGADARILHLAAHACLDDRLPLNSGLFLTLPEGFPSDRENGFLQAWEIFEDVRLDADLVVLSACGSGLGKEMGGEGLISLSRAFQYAGARTVAATLWQVEDRVTAELMVRFYRHLRLGKPKDVALQAAQIELIRGGPVEVHNAEGQTLEVDASAPYFWAPFQLMGDWR